MTPILHHHRSLAKLVCEKRLQAMLFVEYPTLTQKMHGKPRGQEGGETVEKLNPSADFSPL